MQKKLLTMAVAGALAAPCIALAQSSVEVYGTINLAFGKFKYTEGTAGEPSVSKWDVAQGASNYGLRGRENLGGGLTAWFQIEQNAPMERSNNVAITPASRNSAAGIQGAFGNVFLGQWTTPWADLDALWGVGNAGFWGPVTSIIGRRETTGTAPNPNCTNAGRSPAAGICDAVEAAGGIGHAFWRRASQSIFYQSPVFSGVQIKWMYQTNEGKATGGGAGVTTADPSMYSASAQWAGMGGRARVGVAFDRHKDFTTIGKSDTGYAIKGGWNFGVADVGLAYERMTYKAAASDCRAKQYGVALSVPVGPGAIKASYAVAKDIEGDYSGAGTCGATPTAASPSNDNGAKEYNIGYEHRFSKRTNIGIGYAAIKNDPAAVFTWTGAPPVQDGGLVRPANTPFPGSDPSTYFVSITHRF
ncbi:MAG TPA: porin [Burkholderiales bacterium]